MIEGFRLSPQQTHLWSLQQTDQRSPDRAQCAVLIEGPLDLKPLESALQGVFARHETLRTTIACLPGTAIPVQIISESEVLSESGALWIDNHDLRSLEPHEQASALESLLQTAKDSPFDHRKNPAAHISLAALSADRHMLFVTMSALCAD